MRSTSSIVLVFPAFSNFLGDGRKDKSGDFTKGAGLKADDIALVVGAIEPGAQIDARLRDRKIGQKPATKNSTR